MAGYVAMARVESARVRALPSEDARSEPPPACVETLGVMTIDDGEATPLAERLDRIREQLAMTTFFLFDAESWR